MISPKILAIGSIAWPVSGECRRRQAQAGARRNRPGACEEVEPKCVGGIPPQRERRPPPLLALSLQSAPSGFSGLEEVGPDAERDADHEDGEPGASGQRFSSAFKRREKVFSQVSGCLNRAITPVPAESVTKSCEL